MGIPHFAWKRNQEVVLGYSSIGSQVWSALILQPRPQTQRCIHVLQQCLKSNSTTPPIRLQFHIVLGGKVVSYCCCQQTDHNWNNEWHYGPKVASDQNFSSGGHASRILTYMYCVSCACTSMESHLPTWQVSCMHTCTCLAVQCIKLNFCSILVSQQGYFCEVYVTIITRKGSAGGREISKLTTATVPILVSAPYPTLPLFLCLCCELSPQ